MPAEYWYPLTPKTWGTPPSDQWTNNGGADKEASTKPGGGRSGPPSHDYAATYISDAQLGQWMYQHLQLDWPGPVSAVTQLTVRCCTRHVGASSTVGGSRLENASGFTPSSGWTGTDTAWNETADTDVTGDRPGGGDWVKADFENDATWAEVYCYKNGGTERQVTSVWGTLDYAAPPGGWMCLLGLVPPLFSHFLFRADFERFLLWRRIVHPRHTIMTGPEVTRAWEELRAHRHPTFFLPCLVG